MFSNNYITNISLRCDVVCMRTVRACVRMALRKRVRREAQVMVMVLMEERKMRSLLIPPLLFTG